MSTEADYHALVNVEELPESDGVTVASNTPPAPDDSSPTLPTSYQNPGHPINDPTDYDSTTSNDSHRSSGEPTEDESLQPTDRTTTSVNIA